MGANRNVMSDRPEGSPRKNIGRLVAAWTVVTILGTLIAGSALVFGTLWLKEYRRVQHFAEDLVSPDPRKRDRADSQLLDLGNGAEELLEKAARRAPGPLRAECQRVLHDARFPTHTPLFDSLLWLARHQDPDGSWNPQAFSSNCAGIPCSGPGEREFTPGLTGLSVLAFLGAGFSQLSSEKILTSEQPGRLVHFGRVVKKALAWLLAHQAADGSIGVGGPKSMYNHAIAALALSEAYGMTASQPLRTPAQEAVDYLVASQNPGKGWRYSARCGDSDSSVTGWAVLALKSAELSELHFPKSAYDGARAWYAAVTESDRSFRIGYAEKGPGGISREGKEGIERHPTMEALGALALVFMIKKKEERILGATKLVVDDLPEWTPKKIDFVYWHFGSLATFQVDGPDGALWTRWKDPLKEAIVSHQRTTKDGCANGSWDPEGDRWGSAGGRVYAVALNALTLEVYYRYANVFGGAQGQQK